MVGRLPRRALPIGPLALLVCLSAAPAGAQKPAPLLGELRVEGNASIPPDRLGLSKVSERGRPLTKSLIDEGKRSIEEAYAREGYLRARVTPREAKNPQTGLTDVTYDVVEGIIIYIEKAAVDGIADSARKAQAQRLIMLGAGDHFDSDKVRESRRRILRLPWVKAVDINVEAAKAPNKVYVDFDVTES